ncbi:MAG TPA: MlaD family protein [Solirubrobacteraceae bacterium]
MRRLIYGGALALLIGAFALATIGASSSGSAAGTYKIEFDNAFGLVTGADFRVAGVNAGTITGIDLNQKDLHAVVTVQVSQSGFGQFHQNATCESRPQSLIGEYFVECDPGTSGSPVLKPGSTLSVTHTQSTIPADLLADIMRLPYRQRLTLIVNELGAGLAGRSGDLQAALRRAVPAIDQTDRLLNLLGNDSATLQDLTHNANTVITALANNGANVARFITLANNAATDTATQQQNLRQTFQNLPGFLEQLRPALRKLGEATDANEPVLRNLNAAAPEFNRLLTDLPAFSHSALPAIRSLGQASVTGKTAVIAARPTIHDLNQFSTHAPELAQNLAIVLHDLDDRGRAVEKDPRSPGGQGYTGLEALLQYAFIQPLAINTFGPLGHLLAVDAFVSPTCTPYATPQTIANTIAQQGAAAARSCYSMLGPNQPGVTTTDPSNPKACVPDPGGAPTGKQGIATSACKLSAAPSSPNAARAKGGNNSGNGSGNGSASTGASNPLASAVPSGGGSGGGGGSPLPAVPTPNPAASIQSTLGEIGAALGGGSSSSSSSSATSSPSSTSSGGQTQQLLNYLLAP